MECPEAREYLAGARNSKAGSEEEEEKSDKWKKWLMIKSETNGKLWEERSYI